MTVFVHISGGAFWLHNGLNWTTLTQTQADALSAAGINSQVVSAAQFNVLKPLFQDNTLAQIPLTVQGASQQFIQQVSDQQTTVVLQNSQSVYGNLLTDGRNNRDQIISAVNSH